MGISTKVEISGARDCVVELVGLEPATRLLVRPAPQNGAPLNLGLCRRTFDRHRPFLPRLSLTAKFGFPEKRIGVAETPLECG